MMDGSEILSLMLKFEGASLGALCQRLQQSQCSCSCTVLKLSFTSESLCVWKETEGK